MAKRATNQIAKDALERFTVFMAKYCPRVESGTFAAQQCLARWEMEGELAKLEGGPDAGLSRLYVCVRDSIEYAVRIVCISRMKAPPPANHLVGPYVRLADCLERLEGIDDVPGLLARWPKNPGFTIGVHAGWSVLEAGWQFARSIRAGTQIGGNLGTDMYLSSPELAGARTDPPDDIVCRWATGALKELREMTLGPDQFWPTVGAVRHDCAGLPYRLADEFDRAAKATAVNGHADQLNGAAKPADGPDGELRALIVRLNVTERKVLTTMWGRGVTEASGRRPAQGDLAKWIGCDCNTSFKNALSGMVKSGLLGNDKHNGSNGGYYLTSKGARAAQHFLTGHD